ncbi:MAG: hypothetical protein C0412_15015 [Flavobacterium sp.]|nr:hypothetical protein [Flavobacterium sp.]
MADVSKEYVNEALTLGELSEYCQELLEDIDSSDQLSDIMSDLRKASLTLNDLAFVLDEHVDKKSPSETAGKLYKLEKKLIVYCGEVMKTINRLNEIGHDIEECKKDIDWNRIPKDKKYFDLIKE